MHCGTTVGTECIFFRSYIGVNVVLGRRRFDPSTTKNLIALRKLLDWFGRSPVRRLEPFPGEWASFLWDHSAHYRRLPDRLQTVFEQDIQRFIAKHRITGVEMEVDDPLRLLVAASAATLSVGWPVYRWGEVSEVLLYPDNFDRDYVVGRRELAGIAHVWGTVILSVPSLRQGFACYEDPHHVGLHEFAHLLTFDRGQQSKVPVGLPSGQILSWEAIEAHELKRIAGGESIVDPYALQPSEFFPCAVEAFFQKPIEMKAAHRRLYGFLSRYFHQSPALWESRFRARYPG